MLVKYDLCCELRHEFEGWFRTEDEFVRQQNNDLLSCPVCECARANRISAWIVQTEIAEWEVDEAGCSDEYQGAKTLLQQINEYVDQNVDNAYEAAYPAPGPEPKKIKQLHSEGAAALPATVNAGVDKDKLN